MSEHEHEEQRLPTPDLPNGEPPVADDDTQPRPVVPAGTPRPAPQGAAYERLAADEPPIDRTHDTAPTAALGAPARPLLLVVVMAGMLCICITMVGLAGFAGYRDGLATNEAKVTRTLATGIAEQYATGVSDLSNELYELAIARFEWIVETVQPPERYLRDSPTLLAMARTAEAVTPTPSPSPTAPVTLTPTPAPTDTPAPTRTPDASSDATSTLSSSDPAYLYEQAQRAIRLSHYEDAIDWLRSLQSLDPTYRAQEVNSALLEALTLQGTMYLHGANDDGTDQLARGVLLISEAEDLGRVEPQSLLYDAYVAESYLNARSYVNGGNYAAAIPILETLCAEAESTCNWSYRGVSVRDLLERARAGGAS